MIGLSSLGRRGGAGLLDFGFRTARPLWTATHRTLDSRCHETLGAATKPLVALLGNPLTSLRFLRFWIVSPVFERYPVRPNFGFWIECSSLAFCRFL